MTDRNGWHRVTKAKPCTICKRPDWCLLSADGSVAICARIESATRCGDAGWLHRLRDDPFWPARRFVRSIPLAQTGSRNDLASLAAGYRDAVNPAHLDELVRSLGSSVDSLTALRIGWSVHHRAWSFPMTDAAGKVVGIRLRRPNGAKFSVTGGKEGLFLPTDDTTDNAMLICEGATDTAALLDMGFSNVVGRPSCSGGVKFVVDLVQLRMPAEVVIVADADKAGQRGAENLASVLVAYTKLVRVVVPKQFKDVREFFKAGGTRKQLDHAIAAAPARRLAVRAVSVQGR
jgi:hypothetical protein